MAGRGGSAASSRGRGGKFKKYTRGGGKHFSRDLQPIDSEGNQISMWASGARKRGENDDDDDSDDDEEESDSEEEDEDESKPAAGTTAEDASREDRKAQKKARKEAAIARQRAHTVEVGDMPSSDESEDDDMPANPNHSKAARKQAINAKTGDDVEEITEGVSKMKAPASRREREAMEAAAAKERYMKLHAAGKTDEAKADLARLRLIREQREQEAARRQAEKEEREEKEKERRAEIEAREAKKRAAAAGPKKGKK